MITPHDLEVHMALSPALHVAFWLQDGNSNRKSNYSLGKGQVNMVMCVFMHCILHNKYI